MKLITLTLFLWIFGNTILAQDIKTLEMRINNQEVIIARLLKQNDSILTILGNKKQPEINYNPLTQEDSVILFIQTYFAAKKWEDRLNFVLNPNEVTKKMESYYEEGYKQSIIDKKDISILKQDIKINEVFKVLAGKQIIYIKKLSDSYKLDWLATSGYNDISLKTFKANPNIQTAEFRVIATIGTSYLYNYRGTEDTYWNLRIVDIEYNSIYGYSLKSSAEGKKLYEILKDGKEHRLILQLETDRTQDKSGDMAIVKKIISDNWFKQ
jgi:hypothetical protein